MEIYRNFKIKEIFGNLQKSVEIYRNQQKQKEI